MVMAAMPGSHKDPLSSSTSSTHSDPFGLRRVITLAGVHGGEVAPLDDVDVPENRHLDRDHHGDSDDRSERHVNTSHFRGGLSLLFRDDAGGEPSSDAGRAPPFPPIFFSEQDGGGGHHLQNTSGTPSRPSDVTDRPLFEITECTLSSSSETDVLHQHQTEGWYEQELRAGGPPADHPLSIARRGGRSGRYHHGLCRLRTEFDTEDISVSPSLQTTMDTIQRRTSRLMLGGRVPEQEVVAAPHAGPLSPTSSHALEVPWREGRRTEAAASAESVDLASSDGDDSLQFPMSMDATAAPELGDMAPLLRSIVAPGGIAGGVGSSELGTADTGSDDDDDDGSGVGGDSDGGLQFCMDDVE